MHKTILVLLLVPITVSALPLETKDFFSPDEFTNVSISPDGAHIFRVQRNEDSSELTVLNLKTEKIVANWRVGGFRTFTDVVWANDDRILFGPGRPLFAGVRPFVSYWNLKGISLNESNSLHLTDYGFDENAYRVENTLTDDPENILVIGHSRNYRKTGGRGDSLSIEQGSRPIAYLMNVYRRATFVSSRASSRGVGLNLTEIENSPLDQGFLHSDNEGDIRLAISGKGGNTTVLVKPQMGSEWENVTSDFEGAESNKLRFVRFSFDNKSFYLLKYSEHRTMGLFEYVIQDRRLVEIYSHPEFDLTESDIVFSFDGNEVVGVRFWGDLRESVYFSDSPDIQVNQWLDELFPSNLVRIESVSDDGKMATLFVEGAREPGTYYILDVEELQLKTVGNVNSKLKIENLAEAQSFLVEADGGVRIHGIYTEATQSGDGQPTAIVINGTRDTLKYDRLSQYLAQSGYSTLRVDVRGTEGIAYANRSDAVSDSGVVADVNAVLLWAQQAGLTSDGQVCLWGQNEYALLLLEQLENLNSGIDCVVADSIVFGQGSDEALVKIRTNLASIDVPLFLSTGSNASTQSMRQIRRIQNDLMNNGISVVLLAEAPRSELVEEAKNFLDAHIKFEN